MKVDEVAAELGVSNSYAYKLIRELNKELKAAGCIVINGRIDRKFFHEHSKTRKTAHGMCNSATPTGPVSGSKNLSEDSQQNVKPRNGSASFCGQSGRIRT